MKKYFLVFIMLGLSLAILPVQKVAAAELQGGETISVEKTQKNPLVFSNTAKIKSDVKGDLTIFAGDTSVDNSVEDSAYIFSGKANIKAPEIGNRLIVMAGQVNVSSHVKGDLIVFGGDVTVDSPSIVDGDIFVFGGNVFLKGQAGSNLRAGGGKLVLDGIVVQKDAKLWSDQISVNENSKVNGVIDYWAKKQIIFPLNVSNSVSYHEIQKTRNNYASSAIGSILMLAFLVLIMVWLQKSRLSEMAKTAYDKFALRLLTGFITLIAAPFVILLLLISYIGILSAVAFIFIYISAWFIAYAYSTTFVGSLIVKWVSRSKDFKADWITAIVGALAVVLISYIPFIGALFGFMLALLGMGMVFAQLTEKK